MGMTGPILLVPELCHMTGISDEMRSDFRVMRDLATHTCLVPSERKRTLQKLVDQINRNGGAQEILTGWNLQFDKSLIEFSGRVLPTEKIHQKGRSYSYDQNADWTRDIRGSALISPVDISDFLLVFTRGDGQKASEFVKTLTRVAGPMGIRVGRPNMCEIPSDRTEDYLQALKHNIHPKLKLVSWNTLPYALQPSRAQTFADFANSRFSRFYFRGSPSSVSGFLFKLTSDRPE
jgi:aubergine-like protein